MVRTIVAGAVALLLVPAVASAQDRGAPPVVMSARSTTPNARDLGPMPMIMPQRGADFAPPMRADYRRLAYGMTLPRAWAAPPHYIGDFGRYGLPVPADGFGWSRYYDDAVLTDRYGRVYDARYDFERVQDRRFDGRFEGTRQRRGGRARDYSYEGRWTGSWDGGPERTYEGRFDGRVQPHWDMGYIEGRGPSYASGYGPGYDYSMATAPGYVGDCGCGETVTTVTTTTQPSTTTRTVNYDTVRETAPRQVRPAPRGKYVRLTR